MLLTAACYLPRPRTSTSTSTKFVNLEGALGGSGVDLACKETLVLVLVLALVLATRTSTSKNTAVLVLVLLKSTIQVP